MHQRGDAKLLPCLLGCQGKGDNFSDMVPMAAPSAHLKITPFYFIFFFNVNFIWQQPHYGNNRLDQCRRISQTPSSGKEGRQKSMGSLLACAAGCLEVIPVMSCPHFLEVDCSMALGSWGLGERSAGHPGHPTPVGNGLLPDTAVRQGLVLPPDPR